MIINASGRCDIPAFFGEWFINRLKDGYVDVRNPFFPQQVSRILLNKENVDAFIFTTKNPIPFMKYLDDLNDYPYQFQITVTPYKKDIEPYVPNKGIIIEAIKELSKRIGKGRIVLRYDPILINDIYTIEYHEIMFENLLSKLDGHISKVITSFVDMKKNTQKNMMKMKLIDIDEHMINQLADTLGRIALHHQIKIQTCAENYDLSQYGFSMDSCLNKKDMQELIGNDISFRKNKNRPFCQCVETVDIGAYNACKHFCLYCYANYDEKNVTANMEKHNKKSSLILGDLQEDDIIKIRKDK